MVSASIADNGFYVDKEGQILDPESLDSFLTHFGEDLEGLIEQTTCQVITEASEHVIFGPRLSFVFNSEAKAIRSYQCISNLL